MCHSEFKPRKIWHKLSNPGITVGPQVAADTDSCYWGEKRRVSSHHWEAHRLAGGDRLVGDHFTNIYPVYTTVMGNRERQRIVLKG